MWTKRAYNWITWYSIMLCYGVIYILFFIIIINTIYIFI